MELNERERVIVWYTKGWALNILYLLSIRRAYSISSPYRGVEVL